MSARLFHTTASLLPGESLASIPSPIPIFSAEPSTQPKAGTEIKKSRQGTGKFRPSAPRKKNGEGIGSTIEVENGVILTCSFCLLITPTPSMRKIRKNPKEAKEDNSGKKKKKNKEENGDAEKYLYIYEASDSYGLAEGNYFIGIKNLCQVLGREFVVFPSRLINTYIDSDLKDKVKGYHGRGRYVNLWDLWSLEILKCTPNRKCNSQIFYQRWQQLRTQLHLLGERTPFHAISGLNLQAAKIIPDPSFPACFFTMPESGSVGYPLSDSEEKGSGSKRKSPSGSSSGNDKRTKVDPAFDSSKYVLEDKIDGPVAPEEIIESVPDAVVLPIENQSSSAVSAYSSTGLVDLWMFRQQRIAAPSTLSILSTPSISSDAESFAKNVLN